MSEMSETFCSIHPHCPGAPYTSEIATAVTLAILYGYIFYLWRNCSPDWRFKRIRIAMSLALLFYYLNVILSRYEDRTTATLTIVVSMIYYTCIFLSYFQWVSNVSHSAFSACKLIETPAWFKRFVWAAFYLSVIPMILILVGLTAVFNVPNCLAWEFALNIYLIVVIALVCAPLFTAHVLLWRTLKRHVVDLSERQVSSRQQKNLENMRRVTKRVRLFATLSFVAMVSMWTLVALEARGSLTPRSNCTTANFISTAITRFLVFTPPIWHTRTKKVKSASTTSGSQTPLSSVNAPNHTRNKSSCDLGHRKYNSYGFKSGGSTYKHSSLNSIDADQDIDSADLGGISSHDEFKDSRSKINIHIDEEEEEPSVSRSSSSLRKTLKNVGGGDNKEKPRRQSTIERVRTRAASGASAGSLFSADSDGELMRPSFDSIISEEDEKDLGKQEPSETDSLNADSNKERERKLEVDDQAPSVSVSTSGTSGDSTTSSTGESSNVSHVQVGAQHTV